MDSISVTIEWGKWHPCWLRPENAKPQQYNFKSIDERDGFLRGVDECYGWSEKDYRIVEITPQ